MAITYIGINNKSKKINNIYIGVGDKSKKVLKGYVGVDGKAKLFYNSRKLPNYTEIEYLEVNGAGYIDTGITYNQDPRIVVTFEMDSNKNAFGGIIGNGYLKYGQNKFRFYASINNIDGNKILQLKYGEEDSTGIEEYTTIDETITYQKYVLDFNRTEDGKARFYLGNTRIGNFTKSNLSNNSFTPKNILLGGVNYIQSGGLTAGNGIKIYSCQIYNNQNVLLRDFVPCYNNSYCGYYDLVNNIFYSAGEKTNSNITLGPNV